VLYYWIHFIFLFPNLLSIQSSGDGDGGDLLGNDDSFEDMLDLRQIFINELEFSKTCAFDSSVSRYLLHQQFAFSFQVFLLLLVRSFLFDY
jgi:hypothetical protein